MRLRYYKKKNITLHKIKVFAPNGVDISIVTENKIRLIVNCNYQSFVI